jgi:hypothetical protein
MPRRLSAFMGEHPTRAAGGPSCAALEFVRAVRDWFSGRRKEARPCPAPSFPGESARRLGRRGMCAGRDDGIRAGLLPRGGETASDDVAAAGDLPVPVAGCAVRANVVRKYGSRAWGTGSRAWVSKSNMTRHPRGHVIPIPARHIVKLMRQQPRARVQIAQVGSFFVVKIAHFGALICDGFSCRTASNNEEWTSRTPL